MKFIVHPKQKKVMSSRIVNANTNQRVFAADDDEDDDIFSLDDDDIDSEFNDTLDDVADTVEDIQDAVDEIDEDDVSIEMDNNIVNHYIAECDSCYGIFISAVLESDQKLEKISGTCPLCEKETDQYLKWIVRDIEADTEE